MKKVKELLAKLKQKLLAVYASFLDLLCITVPETQPVEKSHGEYIYELTFETSDGPVISDCCEHEHKLEGEGISQTVVSIPDEDFDGVEEALKPVRKARKKASKKKLVKKKKPTKKNK